MAPVLLAEAATMGGWDAVHLVVEVVIGLAGFLAVRALNGIDDKIKTVDGKVSKIEDTVNRTIRIQGKHSERLAVLEHVSGIRSAPDSGE